MVKHGMLSINLNYVHRNQSQFSNGDWVIFSETRVFDC